MAIAIALLRFNDLGRSVAPTFLFDQKQILFTVIRLYIVQNMNKKILWENKTIWRFLSTGHGILPSCGCKARETMGAKCELDLWEEPHELTRFAY